MWTPPHTPPSLAIIIRIFICLYRGSSLSICVGIVLSLTHAIHLTKSYMQNIRPHPRQESSLHLAEGVHSKIGLQYLQAVRLHLERQ